jgi:hypothetical protein
MDLQPKHLGTGYGAIEIGRHKPLGGQAGQQFVGLG